MPGVGLHDVAMGDQRSAPITPITRAAQGIPIGAAQGIAPTRAAQGLLWFGRHALHVHRAVMCTACWWRSPSAEISTLFGQAAGQCHIMGRSRGRIYRNYHEFGSANKRIPCRKRPNAGNHCPA